MDVKTLSFSLSTPVGIKKFSATSMTSAFAGLERLGGFSELQNFIGLPIIVWSTAIGPQQIAGRINVLVFPAQAEITALLGPFFEGVKERAPAISAAPSAGTTAGGAAAGAKPTGGAAPSAGATAGGAAAGAKPTGGTAPSAGATAGGAAAGAKPTGGTAPSAGAPTGGAPTGSNLIGGPTGGGVTGASKGTIAVTVMLDSGPMAKFSVPQNVTSGNFTFDNGTQASFIADPNPRPGTMATTITGRITVGGKNGTFSLKVTGTGSATVASGTFSVNGVKGTITAKDPPLDSASRDGQSGGSKNGVSESESKQDR